MGARNGQLKNLAKQHGFLPSDYVLPPRCRRDQGTRPHLGNERDLLFPKNPRNS